MSYFAICWGHLPAICRLVVVGGWCYAETGGSCGKKKFYFSSSSSADSVSCVGSFLWSWVQVNEWTAAAGHPTVTNCYSLCHCGGVQRRQTATLRHYCQPLIVVIISQIASYPPKTLICPRHLTIRKGNRMSPKERFDFFVLENYRWWWVFQKGDEEEEAVKGN